MAFAVAELGRKILYTACERKQSYDEERVDLGIAYLDDSLYHWMKLVKVRDIRYSNVASKDAGDGKIKSLRGYESELERLRRRTFHMGPLE